MNERLWAWGWRTFEPPEGWLSFFLLVGLTGFFVLGMENARWVTNDHIIRWAAVVGLVGSLWLVRRPWKLLYAGFMLLVALLLTTYLLVSETSLFRLLSGWHLFYLDARLQYFETKLRFLRWLLAVTTGAASRDPLVFTALITLLTGLAIAAMVWTSYRTQRPLPVLLGCGVVLAANSYLGQASVVYVAGFLGLSIFHTAVMRYTQAEQGWEAAQLGYSGEIRVATWLWSGGVAVALVFLAVIVPSVRIAPLVQAFQTSAPVVRAEAELERLFGGVRNPTRPQFESGRASARLSSGVFPREFLLSGEPELTNTAVFLGRPSAPDAYPYWRGQSYDVYTGQGWAISDESETDLTALAPVTPLTDWPLAQITATQTITWLLPNAVSLLFVQGVPDRVNMPTVLQTRTAVADDFSRLLAGVPAEPRRIYTAVSRYSQASPPALRTAQLSNVPPALLAHYTQLPESVPPRVVELAQEITAEQQTAYDQARALEEFLRQYPYDLNVPLPPPDVDPVDYFLFELQRGYCDYYASSMVVMARSLGLPARMVIGYRQPEQAEEPVRQENGHSWVEIYFAGYGWISFEPTAAFPVYVSELDAPYVSSPELLVPDDELYPRTTLPPRTVAEPIRQPWYLRYGLGWALLGFILIILGGGGLWLWRWQDQRWRPDEVEQSYARLKNVASGLNATVLPQQTPHEFGMSLRAKLAQWPLPNSVSTAVDTLIQLYARRQYAPPSSAKSHNSDNRQARRLWRKIRRPLWRTRLQRFWRRLARRDAFD